MSSPQVSHSNLHRPGSLRSVASNSSIASAVSLTRRPRTRTRSRTVTGSSAPADTPPRSPTSELPYLDKPYVQEPLDGPSLNDHEPLIPPVRPPRSPQRPDTDLHIVDTSSSQDSELGTAAEATVVASLPRPATPPEKLNKVTSHASNLSVLDTSYKPPPSAFSRDPALTPVINVRDSLSTQLSGTSSSIYPPSTSTASGPDSPPSPRSIAEQHEDMSPFGPEVNDLEEYDNDDVSYRLRLLVKNNYFLPPAHSKPSPSDFAASTANTQKKQAAPTFLDLFRVGRSKSKPTTPTGTPPGFDPAAPMLRTTSDSITASYALQQPRSSSQTPRISPNPPMPSTRGRVVVVREKMNDIAVAAKQAEQELKTRGVRLDQGSQKAKQELFDSVIDPTDAVDLPPPSSTYPFAVQASALHGLGVQDSVGAALLADRLPPPKSSTMSASWDPEEDNWRKALLHEAVYHSLDNSVDLSSFSQMAGASTPPPRLSGSTTSSGLASPTTKVMLERRIMEPPMMEALDTTPTALSRKKSSHSQGSASKVRHDAGLGSPNSQKTHESSRPSSYLPLRVETPTEPMTPLAPPPRRQFINPLFSLSQTSLPNCSSHPTAEPRWSLSQASVHSLRRSTSSPMLYDGYERHNMTPPPMPRLTIYSNSNNSSQISDSLHAGDEHSRHSGGVPAFVDTHSHYGDDDEDDFAEMVPGRASLALSAINGRPSLSEYSQSSMSPTTSAFQDALNNRGGYQSTASSVHNLSRVSIDQQVSAARESPAPRYTAMSPPPRVSSSLAHVALLPPPRTSSMRYTAMLPRMSSSERSVPPNEEDETMRIVAPGPSTPPLPISARRGNPNHIPLSLDIPTTTIPVAIHSAPGPASPTAFFDTIQTHPNAMDDLDSSSDESEDEEDAGTEPPISRGPPGFADHRVRALSSAASSPRPHFMRLGNHSTPYVSLSNSPIESIRSALPVSNDPSKRPVGNIPVRAPFFTDRKNEQGNGTPSSTFNFYKYAQEHPPATASGAAPGGADSGSAAGPSSDAFGGKRRPATADVAKWQDTQRAQESLRRLDGMLIQHMETEKDTIKRIATTMKQTKSTSRPLTSSTR